MELKHYQKLLKITLDQLERAESEIILLKYDNEYLQMELAKKQEVNNDRA